MGQQVKSEIAAYYMLLRTCISQLITLGRGVVVICAIGFPINKATSDLFIAQPIEFYRLVKSDPSVRERGCRHRQSGWLPAID